LTQPQQVEAMMKQIEDQRGGLDILKTIPALSADRTIKKMSLDEFETSSASISSDVHSHAEKPRDSAQRRTSDHMSSVSGQMGLFGRANYSSSKAAIIALTKVSAREFARQNITVNAMRLDSSM